MGLGVGHKHEAKGTAGDEKPVEGRQTMMHPAK